ncbi:MAG TPA: hypothetical protein VLV18_05890 [Terriglobales bacterium]|nr:hypothetical protein [Terriglobales bacterium]
MFQTRFKSGRSCVVLVLIVIMVLLSPSVAFSQVSDFSLSVSPSSVSIEQGGSGSVTVMVTSYGDFNSAVQLDLSGLPSGVSSSLNPNPVTPPASGSADSQLSLSVDSQTAAGSYPLTVSGVAMLGAPPHETSLTLTVTSSGPAPDFDISVSPSSVSIPQGESDSAIVTITPIGSFSSPVSLSSNGAPYGVSLTFNPTVIITAPGSLPQSTVTITASSTAQVGSYSVTIGGSAGGGRPPHFCTLNIAVTSSGPPPDFDVSVSPSSLQVQQGSYGSSTLAVSVIGSFSSTVFLSSYGGPSGVTITFSSDSITPVPGTWLVSTVSVSVSSTTQPGSYTISLVGSTGYGGTSHDCSLYLTVTSSGPQPDFSLTVSPSSLNIQQGYTGTATLTAMPVGSFSSTVSLSASGRPSQVSISFSPQSITPNIGGQTSSVVSISIGSSASPGTYTITLTGVASSGQSHSCPLVLLVSSGRSSDFTVSLSSSSLASQSGSTLQTVVTLGSVGGFVSPVTLQISNLPSGVSANFGTNPVIPPSGGSSSSILTLTLSSPTQPGTYTMTITATSSNIVHRATLTLTVSQSPKQDFSFSSSSALVTITAGSTSTLVLSISSINGFSSNIQFTSTWLGATPAGVTLTNPTAITIASGKTTTANLVLTTTTSTGSGTYTLQVTASGSGISHSLTTVIEIQSVSTGDFGLQLSASKATLTPGSHSTITATIQSIGAFKSPVSLSHTPIEEITLSYSTPVTPSVGGVATVKILIEASPQASSNVWTVTLTGKSNGMVHSVTLTITIEEVISPDFSISPATNTLHLSQGGSDSTVITISSQGGFTSAVQLSASWVNSIPTGITFTLPSSVTPLPSLYASSVLMVNANSNAQVGTYLIRVVSESGSLIHAADLTVIVGSSVTTVTTTADSPVEIPTIAYLVPIMIVIGVVLTVILLRGRKRS